MEPFEKHQLFEEKRVASDRVYFLIPGQKAQKGNIYLVFIAKKGE